MAFDINGFGGGFGGGGVSPFDSGRVRAKGAGGLEDATAANGELAGKLAGEAMAGYSSMLQAKEMAKAYKDQAKAKSGGLGGLGGILGSVAGSFLGPIGGAAGKAIGGLFG